MSKSNGFIWQGRKDKEDGVAGARWHDQINQSAQPRIALCGYKCDLGVAANKGRVGAQQGPDAIRGALANVAWHLKGGVADAGDTEAQASVENTQIDYANKIASLLDQYEFTIGLGGGHDIAWGSYKGLYQWSQGVGGKKIGIINFDAHFDLRKPSPNASSGTPFFQIASHCEKTNIPFQYACLGIAETSNTQALFERAEQLKVRYLRDLDTSVSSTKELLTPILKQIDELYLTICLDVFSSEKAPGVSAPSALGIPPEYVIAVIHWIAASQKQFNYRWRLADIAEMNPLFDIDARTAKLAARLIHEMAKAQ